MTRMVLFTGDKSCKQPKYPTVEEWLFGVSHQTEKQSHFKDASKDCAMKNILVVMLSFKRQNSKYAWYGYNYMQNYAQKKTGRKKNNAPK